MPPVILDNKMYLGGYIYLQSRVAKGRVYWDCRKLRGGECKARAVTSDPTDGEPVEVYKGVPELDHSHPPNQEETAAGQLTTTLKRKAVNHPEQPPAQNIELLCDSPVWFLDGTFKTAPDIFAQIFTIIGLRKRTGKPEEVVAIPLVYALLSSKETDQYQRVLEVVKEAVQRYRIQPCAPSKIMTDFELGIHILLSDSTTSKLFLVARSPLLTFIYCMIAPSIRSKREF